MATKAQKKSKPVAPVKHAAMKAARKRVVPVKHHAFTAAHTANVLASAENAPDPRFKKIIQTLIRHLHDFVREVELTEAEWAQAIAFLTRTGHMCNDKRQEFILLSDTLGVSMLVDAINHRRAGGATENTVFGPFHVEGSPELPLGGDIRFGVEGEATFVHGRVLSLAGKPIENAVVEVWQVRPDMLYDVQDAEAPGMQLRGTFRTDADGKYAFWTVKPVTYPIPYDGPVGDMLKASARHPWRPAHIHFRLRASGYHTVVTHLFVSGDEYLNSDAVFGVKDSLIVEFRKKKTKQGEHYDVQHDFILAQNK